MNQIDYTIASSFQNDSEIVASDSRSYLTLSINTSTNAPSIKSPDISIEINKGSKTKVISDTSESAIDSSKQKESEIIASESRSYIIFSTDTSVSPPSLKSPNISNETNEKQN